MRPTESVEKHLRYAGAVGLVAMIRARVPGPQGDLFAAAAEDDHLDALALQQAQELQDEGDV